MYLTIIIFAFPGAFAGSKTHQPPPTRTIPPDGTTFSEIKFGQKVTNEVPPYSYWNMQFYQPEPAYVKFDYSFPRGTSVAVYGRKNALPTHTQYHMVELLNGFKNRGTRTSHVSTYLKNIFCITPYYEEKKGKKG